MTPITYVNNQCLTSSNLPLDCYGSWRYLTTVYILIYSPLLGCIFILSYYISFHFYSSLSFIIILLYHYCNLLYIFFNYYLTLKNFIYSASDTLSQILRLPVCNFIFYWVKFKAIKLLQLLFSNSSLYRTQFCRLKVHQSIYHLHTHTHKKKFDYLVLTFKKIWKRG